MRGKLFIFGLSFILPTLVETAQAETVYFCSETHSIEIENHKLTQYKPQKFKFKVDEKNLEFGKGGFFDGSVSPITFWAGDTYFTASTKRHIIRFSDGSFVFANALSIDGGKGSLITAKCDKF